MSQLVLGLYAEGYVDAQFLPIIIQRSVQQLLTRQGRQVLDVAEPFLLNEVVRKRQLRGQAERILAAAQWAVNFHAIIVHADADHPDRSHALTKRIQPGLDLVRGAAEGVCRQIVPLIPIQMTEAWMLADPDALKIVVHTDVASTALGLPTHAQQVESDPDPKHTLRTAVQIAGANRRRGREVPLDTIYQPLARRIALTRLQDIPAYQQFMADMLAALRASNLA